MDINEARRNLEAEFYRLFNKQPYTFVERLIDLIQAERHELRKTDPTTSGNRIKQVRPTGSKRED